MPRVNPKSVSTGSVIKTITDPKVNPIIPFFEGIFGEPTVKKTPPTTPQTTVTVPQTGAQGQGGCRGQQCNGGGNNQKTECYTVYGNDLQLTQAAVDYYRNIGVDISKCGTTTPVVNGNLEQRVKELEQLSWTYPEVIGTASQRSNVDVWNHLSQWVWGHGGEKWQAGGSAPKWDQPEPNALLPMTLRLHQEQETRLTQAHAHRQSIETKVEELYTHKSEKGHTHAEKNGGTDWGVVVMGILAIVVILIIVKYLFPLLGGLKGILPKRGGGVSADWSNGQ